MAGASRPPDVKIARRGGVSYTRTEFPYNWMDIVDSVSVNRFRDNLKSMVERVINSHEPLKVARRSGADFVVISAEDWEREQESLYVLQNGDLMRQIAVSLTTHSQGTGYRPADEQMHEITGV